RIIGIVLVVVGVVLLWQGWQARQTVGSQLSEAFGGGTPSEAIWMLAGGAILAVVGAILAARR
ncbi:MAG: DUF3185 family protein, partial [Gammaproteobacteria bacterium]|nr:DUF3185 family protein [Gammaproteobacteria bacterium]NIR98927.1 DUF3185 family protein [Gammaproteobacteria bacterium]NIV21194.1 DUF3185 family protein [Gammaproteobacteria bacterium]